MIYSRRLPYLHWDTLQDLLTLYNIYALIQNVSARFSPQISNMAQQSGGFNGGQMLIYIIQLMKQGVNDMICFNSECIRSHTQLFSSSDSSEQHSRLLHHCLLIDPRMPCFKILRQKPIQFKVDKQDLLARIDEDHGRFKEMMMDYLDEEREKSIEIVNELYRLDHRHMDISIYDKHLLQRTEFSSLYLHVLNLLHQQGNVDIHSYICNLPAHLWQKKAEMLKETINTLKSHDYFAISIPSSSSEAPQPAIPVFKQWDNSLKAKEERIEKVRGKMEPQYLRKVCEEIIECQGKLSYKSIDPRLKAVFDTQRKHKSFEKYFCAISRSTVNNIERLVLKHFNQNRGTRMAPNHKERVYKDIKEYKLWMERAQCAIFQRCLRLFNGYDQGVEIGEYEIYVIHIRLQQRIIDNSKEKQLNSTCQAEPMDLPRELAYFFYHFDNYQRATEVLTKRYPSIARKIRKEFEELVCGIYDRIVERERIEFISTFPTMLGKCVISRELNAICSLLIQYYIHSKLEPQEIQRLASAIKEVTFAFERSEEQEKESAPTWNHVRPKPIKQLIEIDEEPEQDRAQRKNRLIRETKVKLEEIQLEDSKQLQPYQQAEAYPYPQEDNDY